MEICGNMWKNVRFSYVISHILYCIGGGCLRGRGRPSVHAKKLEFMLTYYLQYLLYLLMYYTYCIHSIKLYFRSTKSYSQANKLVLFE